MKMKYQISKNPNIWKEDYKIIPRWWEINEIIYVNRINLGFHFKIGLTCRKIEEIGYK